jgi:hypothetical protein
VKNIDQIFFFFYLLIVDPQKLMSDKTNIRLLTINRALHMLYRISDFLAVWRALKSVFFNSGLNCFYDKCDVDKDRKCVGIRLIGTRNGSGKALAANN